PPGHLRVDLGGEYLRVDSRFGEGSDSDPWGLDGALGAERFPALAGPAAAFDDFLSLTSEHATEASAVSGKDLSAGTLRLDAVVAARSLPIRLALGLFSRVEVGASV